MPPRKGSSTALSVCHFPERPEKQSSLLGHLQHLAARKSHLQDCSKARTLLFPAPFPKNLSKGCLGLRNKRPHFRHIDNWPRIFYARDPQ